MSEKHRIIKRSGLMLNFCPKKLSMMSFCYLFTGCPTREHPRICRNNYAVTIEELFLSSNIHYFRPYIFRWHFLWASYKEGSSNAEEQMKCLIAFKPLFELWITSLHEIHETSYSFYFLFHEKNKISFSDIKKCILPNMIMAELPKSGFVKYT